MMLDLNLISTDEIALIQNTSPTSSDPQNFLARAVTNDHGSSDSSVISVSPSNTWDEELSSRRSVPRFVLEIAKKEGSETLFGSTAASIVTRELFPLTKAQHGGKEIGFSPLSRAATLCATSSSGAASHWVDFSFNQSNLNRQHENSMKQQQVKKSRRGPRSRSSQYRGVTFYRRTGRWESHIWDCGKQVYLGGFDTAHAAARAYDRAAIKFRGVDADINFNLSDYDDDMRQTRNLSKEEFVQVLRRQSTGFSRGTSKYRGVTLHKCGRWEARMGQLLGKKAYDKAAIKYNGREAMTNFQPGNYEELDTEVSVDLDLKISQPLSHSPPAVATPWRSTSCPVDRHVPVTELTWQLLAPARGAYSAASSGFSLSSAPPRR